MGKYLAWFKYLTKHRWYVMLECFKKGIYLRGLLHDIDKYLPYQFIPYANYHFNSDGSRINRRDSTGHYDAFESGDTEFEMSIYLHWRRSKHHWESWVIPHNDSKYKVFPMDMTTIKEMICDWKGAGKANGTPDIIKWYKANKEKLILHPDTREIVENLLKKEGL